MSGPSHSGNGHGNGALGGELGRHVRVDDRRDAPEVDVLGPQHAGRSFVLALGFVLMAFALALFVVFRQWKDQQVELAEYGARNVATAVGPLAAKVPPGIEPVAWARVVDQSRVALEALCASGTLELPQMQSLRRELLARIDPARPETSATILEEIWTMLVQRAGPGLTRLPKLELMATLEPLARRRPESVSPEEWDLALARTRAMLIAVAADPKLPSGRRRALRDRLSETLLETSLAKALEDLAWVWTTVDEAGLLPEGFTAPRLGAH